MHYVNVLFPGDLAGACNFNMPEDQWETLCQLVQDQDDDFDWQIGRKHQGTGPSTDHSLGRCYSTTAANFKTYLFYLYQWNQMNTNAIRYLIPTNSNSIESIL